ncbi:hypothetical protein BCV71DRAFT_251714 [Rhizopus microsporus]|uniref:Uncharacterized protein n=1 Tax=Rhizopus microsporus TaxID=58291 RepID=A0A1X0RNR1_RHIZD|nr:hypothetical protein BCV71DRAFT_251714 [Rhizopus microsporus]
MRSLSHTSLCKTVLSTTEDPDARSFKAAKRCLLLQNLEIRQRCRNSKLPRCIRWRLCWLPGGKPQPFTKHPTQQLSKNHGYQLP